LVARPIHATGEWRTKPFVAAKCGAPESAQDTPQLPDEAAPYPADTPSDVPAVADLALLDAAGEVRPLQEVEAELIRFAIGHYHGQMSEVARRLRISRSTLYRKLEALKLAP
jgi:DNA-binding NtrC family response regulator